MRAWGALSSLCMLCRPEAHGRLVDTRGRVPCCSGKTGKRGFARGWGSRDTVSVSASHTFMIRVLAREQGEGGHMPGSR